MHTKTVYHYRAIDYDYETSQYRDLIDEMFKQYPIDNIFVKVTYDYVTDEQEIVDVYLHGHCVHWSLNNFM